MVVKIMLRRLITQALLIIVILSVVYLTKLTSVQAAINSKVIDTSIGVDRKLESEVLQIIRNHPEVVIESFQTYKKQQKEKQEQAKKLFSQELISSPQKIIAESPRTNMSAQKIVLLEFADFQCPYCTQAHKILKQFMVTHKDEVTLVYKNLPLISIHPEAMASAKAAWAAQQQGKFWQYHDALFNQQDKLGEQLYLDIAKTLNLDLNQFDRDRHSQKADIAIEKDIEIADQIGIQGTPFLVINGQFFSGAVPLSTLEKAL